MDGIAVESDIFEALSKSSNNDGTQVTRCQNSKAFRCGTKRPRKVVYFADNPGANNNWAWTTTVPANLKRESASD